MEFEIIEEPAEIDPIEILCCSYDYLAYGIDPDEDEGW
jgi:hypothetical protein